MKIRCHMLRSAVLATVSTTLFSVFSISQAKTNVYKVTSPIQSLATQLGAAINDSTEPYHTGEMSPDRGQVVALLTSLGAASDKTTIIHLLRWNDASRTTVMFQKWYLYDPTPSKTPSILRQKSRYSRQPLSQDALLLQFVYIHLEFQSCCKRE